MSEVLNELGAHIREASEGIVDIVIAHEELTVITTPEAIVDVAKFLRDDGQCAFVCIIDVCGVDWPTREKRFDVVYHLLSPTQNVRVRIKLEVGEDEVVPSITPIFPGADWFERETWDMYGIPFSGHPDLRRILTDYGFEGHPFRKDFPLTGYHELRYSEDEKRVVYEPVELAQDLRQFDFMSPWEGADYVLPGDEKADVPPVDEPKTTETPKDTGAGKKTDEHAADKVSAGAPAEEDGGENVPAPEPTEDQPARAEREGKTTDTAEATEPDTPDNDAGGPAPAAGKRKP